MESDRLNLKQLKKLGVRWKPTGGVKKIGELLYARCKCSCGILKWIQISTLKNGNSRGCRACAALAQIKKPEPLNLKQLKKLGVRWKPTGEIKKIGKR